MNVFEGGFLGLDNITVVDRSEKLPDGAILEQSDATGWMGFFCLHMMRIAHRAGAHNRVYEGDGDEVLPALHLHRRRDEEDGRPRLPALGREDGFFYDVLRLRDGSFHKFAVRSLVGLIPLFAIDVLEEDEDRPPADFIHDVRLVHPQPAGPRRAGVLHGAARRPAAARAVDRRPASADAAASAIWDESEFLSAGGIRSLSKHHERHPFSFGAGTVRYEPAEADVKIKGGNSNWRGPIWFPTSYLLIESLMKFGAAHGPEFMVDTPAGGRGRRSDPPRWRARSRTA